MKLLTNEQITAACAELDIVRSNRLNNAFIANLEGRKEDADRHMAAATAMHWAIQKLMEDWSSDGLYMDAPFIKAVSDNPFRLTTTIDPNCPVTVSY